MVRILSVLSLLVSSVVFADTTIEKSLVIGCPLYSDTSYVTLKSEVEIQKSFFDTHDRDETIENAIQQQLKYLVGIFKEYHTKDVQKFSFGKSQTNFKIIRTEVGNTVYPVPDIFWPSHRGTTRSEYVNHLLKEGGGDKKVTKVFYQVDLHLFSCRKSKQTLEKDVEALNHLKVPKDPYLGFWINTKAERELGNFFGLPKTIHKPLCLNWDFYNFGMPEDAWFFWSPVQFPGRSKCKISNQKLVTIFEFTLHKNSREPQVPDAPIAKTLQGSVFFGALAAGNKRFEPVDLKNLAHRVQENISLCKTLSKPECLTIWARLAEKSYEPGAHNLLAFFKYLQTVIFVEKFKVVDSTSDSVVFHVEGKSAESEKRTGFNIYYGPTGIYEPMLASTEYWNRLRSSLHQDDFILYVGHAGIGTNLRYKTILERSTPGKFVKRTKPLYFGIFNCEGLSYHGFDYRDLFNLKESNGNIDLIATSGVEASFSFTLSYLQFLLTNDVFKAQELQSWMNSDVISRDFLGYQKIRYTP